MNIRSRLARLETRTPEPPAPPPVADDAAEADWEAVCAALDEVALDQRDTNTMQAPIDLDRAAPFGAGLDDASRKAFVNLAPYAKVFAELARNLKGAA